MVFVDDVYGLCDVVCAQYPVVSSFLKSLSKERKGAGFQRIMPGLFRMVSWGYDGRGQGW